MGKSTGRHRKPQDGERRATEGQGGSSQETDGKGSVVQIKAFDERSAEYLHQNITKTLKFGDMVEMFPQMIVRAIEFRIWEHRFCHAKGRPFRTFIEYLTHHEPDGAQVELERVEQLISHDPKALTAWRQEATRPANRPTREISHDNVMTSRQGNSLGYTLARLARVDPGLHADVCAGKLSAQTFELL